MPFRIGTDRIGRLIVGQILDSDYQAILDYATTQGYTLPSSGQQIIQNQLVLDMKSAGAWSGLTFFYVFATDGDRDFAKINWANPGTYNATEISTPTFTTDLGFTGNGTSTALDSGFDPQAVWAGGDDVSMGGWFDLTASGNGTLMGSYSTTRTHLIADLGGTSYYNIASNQNPSVGGIAQTDGLWVNDNDGAGNTRLFVNGVQQATASSGITDFSRENITILTRKRTSSTYDIWSPATAQMAFWGNRAVGQNIYSSFNTYITSI